MAGKPEDGGFRSKGIDPNGGFNDLTVLPKPGIMVFGEIIPKLNDPTIQVSELWSFAQIFEDVFERISRTNSLRTPFIFADMDPKMRVDPFDVDICAVKNGKARSADCGVQLRFELFIAESDPHKLGSPCNFGESHPSQTPTAPFK